MANQPIKKYKSGLIQGAIWLNEKDVDGDKVGFKTASLRRSWKDKDNQWRDETMNLRKTDIPKALVILNKIQEDLLLGDDNDE